MLKMQQLRGGQGVFPSPLDREEDEISKRC